MEIKTLVTIGTILVSGLFFNGVKTRNQEHSVTEYVIGSRSDVEKVLENLRDYTDRYEFVSVAHYYDQIGIIPKLMDSSYGWSGDSIHKFRVVKAHGGYVIKFPPVEVI